MNTFIYIYTLVDPKTSLVRYVGMAKNVEKRYKEHFTRLDKNTHKTNWIKQLLSQGIYPELHIQQKIKMEYWQEAEQFWISYYRNAGYPLTNSTDGGEGTIGWHPTDEQRKKQSVNWTGYIPPPMYEKDNHFYGKCMIGDKNANFDNNIYSFYNKLTGVSFEGTQYNFKKKFNISSKGKISLLKHGKIKSHKGWIICQ